MDSTEKTTDLQRNLYISYENFKTYPERASVVVLKDGRELFYQEISIEYNAKLQSAPEYSRTPDIQLVAVINSKDIASYKSPKHPIFSMESHPEKYNDFNLNFNGSVSHINQVIHNINYLPNLPQYAKPSIFQEATKGYGLSLQIKNAIQTDKESGKQWSELPSLEEVKEMNRKYLNIISIRDKFSTKDDIKNKFKND